MKFRKALSGWLTHHYQLIIRNEKDLAEKSTFRFNYAKLIFLSTTLLIFLVGCSLVLATTILAKWLNPTHIEQENKKKIALLSIEVKALEKQTIQQKNFITLLQSIIAGKEPPSMEFSNDDQEQAKKIVTPNSSSQLVKVNVPLQSAFKKSDTSPLDAHSEPIKTLQARFLFPPINGIVTKPFNHSIGHYGVDIVAKANEPIKCVADGVVIFAARTVKTGWVIVIQHSKDLLSVYKNNATLCKEVGNFVKREEVIATAGNSGKLSTGSHLHFELWYKGTAVNPKHFITF